MGGSTLDPFHIQGRTQEFIQWGKYFRSLPYSGANSGIYPGGGVLYISFIFRGVLRNFSGGGMGILDPFHIQGRTQEFIWWGEVGLHFFLSRKLNRDRHFAI